MSSPSPTPIRTNQLLGLANANQQEEPANMSIKSEMVISSTSRGRRRRRRHLSTTKTNPTRELKCALAASIVSLIAISAALTLHTGGVQAADVKGASNGNSTTLNIQHQAAAAAAARQTTSTKDTSTKSATKSAAVSQLDQQSSNLDSMYVQIPIAEPIEAPGQSTSSNEQQQQQADDSSDPNAPADSQKATTWTGPWPKKFQIGYIKQSDLHQVLIESLKGGPFMGAQKSSASPSSKTSPASTQAPPRNEGATKSLSSATTTQAPTAGTKSTLSSEAAAVAPQAPPSDASSLMQSVSYPQHKAVQHTSAMGPSHLSARPNMNHHHQNQNQNLNLNQHNQHHQHHQSQASPYVNRLASPQVQPRPNSMLALSKGNLYQPPTMTGHNNMHHQRGQPLGPQPHRLHSFMPNNFQHHAPNHHNNHHQNQRPSHQAPFPSPTMGGHHQGPQGYKFAGPMPPAQFQQVAKLPMAAFAQQQFQFAGYPSFKNQPIYTMNNFPTQQQQQQQVPIDADQLQLIQMANQQPNSQPARQQKTKSDYQHSSWRPMPSTSEEAAGKSSVQQQQQQQLSNNQAEFGPNDGFDDGFGMPANTGLLDSMNRHPVLNSFLSPTPTSDSTSPPNSGKASPAKMLKQQQQHQAAAKGQSGSGTKSAAPKDNKWPTKGDSASQERDIEQRSEGTKSDTGRRTVESTSGSSSSSSTSTTPSSSSSSDNSTRTTTPNPSGEATTSLNEPTTTTSPASTTTMANSATNQTTTTQESSAETTTDPDSEVFESETTEPSTSDSGATSTDASAATTTDSSLASGSRSSTASSPASSSTRAPPSVGQMGENGEAEVVTQQSASAVTFPSAMGQGEESTTWATSSSTTASSSGGDREETTPTSMVSNSEAEGASSTLSSGSGSGSSSTSTSASADATTKTDASMSDEALMAAAVRASDQVTKSNKSKQQAQKSAGPQIASTKRARSSERVVQSSNLQQATTTTPSSAAAGSPASQSPTSQASAGSGVRKTPGNPSNKLITRKASPAAANGRAAKQIAQGVKGASAGSGTKSAALLVGKQQSTANATQVSGRKSAALKKRPSSAANKSSASGVSQKSAKFTRMASAAEQQQQVVSMTAAQAQSAAQTLASLLLSRCLSSTNCAHLLDICSTKQAAVPLALAGGGAQQQANSTRSNSNSNSNSSDISAAWSVPVGLMSSNLMGLMQALQAERALQVFPAWRETIETIMDQDAQAGYTLLMPSNDAIDRMAAAQVDSLLANADLMSQLIDNHILDSAESIDLPSSRFSSSQATSTTMSAPSRNKQPTRYVRSKGLQISQHRDRMVTINGKRVVYANQQAPANGRIHVIDGVLDWPNLGGHSATPAGGSGNNNMRLLDIMDTLKQCDKFDGFVTLAEGTGLAQILKQDEPLTVFVPSNEALRKIPDDELEVIKNNSTALREFIMYHIVNGSYFSQDLRDGQQLPSILDMRPIQVGVRVDGCSRRLVEANTSPMRRPDIAAKNGVIHILDWYLTTRDNELCDPIGRFSGAGATSSGNSANPPSERLQQLASEPMAETSGSSVNSPVSMQHQANFGSAGYATRMSSTSLPANHKPAGVTVVASAEMTGNLIKPTKLMSSTDPAGEQTNSVYVSAVPMGEVVHVP